MVSIATLDKALKTLYIGPVRQMLNVEADPFVARIKHTSEMITGNNGIERAAQVGINGGYGAGSETGTLPNPGGNMYQRLYSTTKNLYAVIQISDKAMKSIRGADKGSFVDVVDREIRGVMDAAKWNFARQIAGRSNGVLTTCKAGSGASNKIAVNEVRMLIEGLTIDILTSDGGDIAKGRRIKNINRSTNEITIDGAAVTVSAGNIITAQNSYGLEITGLEDIFDTSATKLYGNDRAGNDWLNPYVDNNFGTISDARLTEAIMRQEDYFNVNIDYLRAGNDAYHAYAKYLEERVRLVNTTKLEGGYKALKMGESVFIRSKFMQSDSIDLLDTQKFYIDQVADWDWIPGTKGEIFTQIPNTPTYTATLTKYADLMCVNPAGQARLKGVTAPASNTAAAE